MAVVRVAVLDANVLWPQYLRDALVRASIADLYRAAWTDRILEEMRDSLIRRDRVSSTQIDKTVRLMRQTCAQYMVEGYEDLIPVMTNQEKDRHVLAAAMWAGADTVVTYNIKHFPPKSCEKYCIDVDTPDEFLLDLWFTAPGRKARMLVEWAPTLTRPPITVQELLQSHLAKHAPNFATAVLSSSHLESLLEAQRNGIRRPSYRLL